MMSIAEHISNPIKKRIYKFVARQFQYYEKVQYKKLKTLLYTFVSVTDKEYFEKVYGLNKYIA